ncbi:MAG: hypothetical protein DCC71_25125 [Proteobacteria bacterium]|nr:MAG: hypothetical protein DCC71_25125 [Pseudomonadota bacterium]
MDDLVKVASEWIQAVWNDKRLDWIERLAAPHCVFHDAAATAAPEADRAQFRANVEALQSAVPDIQFHVDDAFACRDRVVLRVRVTGTHTGPGLPFAPSNRPFSIGGITMGRYEDGKLVEAWNCFDLLGLYTQLGRTLV